jgi:chemotaxis response regulator CheB
MVDAAADRKLPPGIRSWTDGRVMADAKKRYELVVIGCSMGGMQALQIIFGALFESAAMAYGSNVIGVVLTGANADGSKGAARIKERGGFVVVQDPATAESPAMPQAAVAATRVDRILPLERIGPFLVELCRNST